MILKWFYNLPIRRKQLIALFTSEVISIVGLVGTGSLLIISGGRSLLVNQAKSELAVTEINYNIKINQMGFGFRGQSDNVAIISAAQQYSQFQKISPSLQQEVKKILQNEVKARKIEYATLVSQDFRIIANANRDRQGEIFNPQNLVTQVFRKPEQIKTSEIVSWEELTKENPPLPSGVAGKESLIRYTVTPVKDPQTRQVIGALISGDIVNQKLPIVTQTLDAQDGGYSAVYLQSSTGEFHLATAAIETTNSQQNPDKTTANSPYLLNFPLPNTSLLASAVTTNNQIVTERISLQGKTYTVAAKKLINYAGKPVAVLVRGTPETDLNNLLRDSLALQAAIAILTLLIDIGLAGLLGRAIARPVKHLTQVAKQFSQGKLTERAEVMSKDEIGELAVNFNNMAERLSLREQTIQEQMQQLQATLAELQETQTQLIQTEKMSSLGQMVAGIAHEINNPTSFICGNLSPLTNYVSDVFKLLHLYQKSYPETNAEINQLIQEIDLDYLQEDLPKLINSLKVGSDRIAEIVLSLRNFSRLDEAECKFADIHSGIDSTLMILNHRLKVQPHRCAIAVTKEYNNLPPVECYPGQLNQVLMNILSNAIDALEEVIETHSIQPQIQIRTQHITPEAIAIHIKDNALGIPETLLAKIFDPFFTTKPVGKGTGIGLSISYQIIVEKHQGELQCLSTPDKGTEFIIQIPITQKVKNSTENS
ncbi:sensor histidine kinase [Calothrix sp. 336/3]|uniref:sensor histidine kinase n=1 Tax=Calothrix sp. 336/3 TaxID=1337936 RepID=UPI0004E33BF4|nr:ATP-binding protein [Calothrix sp. 336/3]AKG20313.1 histidine kinase [Calothrix sp. 336/3]